MCHQLKLIRGNQDYRTVGSEERRGRKLPHGIKSHDLVYYYILRFPQSLMQFKLLLQYSHVANAQRKAALREIYWPRGSPFSS